MYLHIESAIKELAYDNGCINRHCTEDEYLKRVLGELIAITSERDLGETETFLSWLNPEQLNNFMCGEDMDRKALLLVEQAEIADRVLESVCRLL